MLHRINAGIGHIKLTELRPQHLNNLYEQLSQKGKRENNKKATCKADLREVLKNSGITKENLSKQADISLYVLTACYNKEKVSYKSAEIIANALNKNINSLFDIIVDDTPLSSKTVVEHHRLISTILAQAEKEMLITYNPARKSTPPKAESTKPNYFQPEEIEAIRNSLERVDLKWKVIVHLLLITGARRGEIAGLKWDAVDFKNNQIHISNNLLYAPDIGLYQDRTKTLASDRFVKLPEETMKLLKEYQEWLLNLRSACGTAWNDSVEISNKDGIKHTEKNSFLFVQDSSNKLGYPIYPDSITGWCDTFSERSGLPHINPHAFLHTMASILYFNGVDSISISKRLGHAKVSTTVYLSHGHTNRSNYNSIKQGTIAIFCCYSPLFGFSIFILCQQTVNLSPKVDTPITCRE